MCVQGKAGVTGNGWQIDTEATPSIIQETLFDPSTCPETLTTQCLNASFFGHHVAARPRFNEPV
jgi:hypothetical protein